MSGIRFAQIISDHPSGPSRPPLLKDSLRHTTPLGHTPVKKHPLAGHRIPRGLEIWGWGALSLLYPNVLKSTPQAATNFGELLLTPDVGCL